MKFMIPFLMMFFMALPASQGALASDLSPLPKEIFARLDDNKDGFVDMNELKSHHQEFYDKLDKDNDDKVTLAETTDAGKSEKRFDALNTHAKDGHVTFEESLQVEEARFQHADTDNDKRVSLAEYVKHVGNLSAPAKL